MDHNVNAAARHFDGQEAAAEDACARAASAHGLTAEQAEQCDDCNNGCPSCPFKRAAHGVEASDTTVNAHQTPIPSPMDYEGEG